MKETEAAYFAGIIDGEGTITLGHARNCKYRIPTVSFPSTSEELMTYFRKICGGTVVKKKTYKEHHLPSWECRLRYNGAIDFLREIIPYLKHSDKLYRAGMLVERYPEVTVRNGKYTPEQHQEKLKFENEFFHPSTS